MNPLNSILTNRREMLQQSACGFGSLGLAGMCQEDLQAKVNPLAAKKTHHKPRAKRVIFIFMQGGPSHVDSFDYKPKLVASDGKSYSRVGVRSGDFGKTKNEKLMKPLWKFKQYGKSGHWVSELFPHIAKHVDDLCFLQGIHTNGVAHGPTTLFLHTGATNLVRPAVGSWITYGLGSESDNLPGFLSISPSAANGGPRNYSNAFLPEVYQGTSLGEAGLSAAKASIRHIRNAKLTDKQQRRQLDLLQKINQAQKERSEKDQTLDSVIQSFELAYRMQGSVPKVMDLSGESKATLKKYGIGEKATDDFGRQCLMARRFSEAGVRYVQITYGDNGSNPRWDQHSNMPQHAKHAKATDQPVAALLADLKARGLLEDTLVWWGGEFGRTPFSQSKNGRDHNPLGFTMFLAGGGTKPGFSYGETDDIGHRAVTNKVHMHDMHATLLHLLGMNHKKLTYRYAGRDFRLTDVHGRVIKDIMV